MLPSEIHTIIVSYIDDFVDLDNYTIVNSKINYIELIQLNFQDKYCKEIKNYNARIIYIDLLTMSKYPNFKETAEYLYLDVYNKNVTSEECTNLLKYNSIKLFEVFEIFKLQYDRKSHLDHEHIIFFYLKNKCYEVIEYINKIHKIRWSNLLFYMEYHVLNYSEKITDSMLLRLIKIIPLDIDITLIEKLTLWPKGCLKTLSLVLDIFKDSNIFDVDNLIEKMIFTYNGYSINPDNIKLIYERYKSQFTQEHTNKLIREFKKDFWNQFNYESVEYFRNLKV